MTKLNPHCGQCSQCVDRRFAILAAGQEQEDPNESFDVGLLLGVRGNCQKSLFGNGLKPFSTASDPRPTWECQLAGG
jgi:hypothetical protein